MADGPQRARPRLWPDGRARGIDVVRRVLPDWSVARRGGGAASAADLDATLGAEPGTYAGIAAVTAPVGRASDADGPVHVFVNPEVTDGLRRAGRAGGDEPRAGPCGHGRRAQAGRAVAARGLRRLRRAARHARCRTASRWAGRSRLAQARRACRTRADGRGLRHPCARPAGPLRGGLAGLPDHRRAAGGARPGGGLRPARRRRPVGRSRQLAARRHSLRTSSPGCGATGWRSSVG